MWPLFRATFALGIAFVVSIAGFGSTNATSYGAGLNQLRVDVGGRIRAFWLQVPATYQKGAPHPLLIAVPGCQPIEAALMHEEFGPVHQNGIIVVLEGCLNVGPDAKAEPGRSDDVVYTQAVVNKVMAEISIDQTRIFCTGHSRGGRFCSRLASELSSTIAAIAPFSGLRFPVPNNATRAIPIVSFHATADSTNPFWGNGAYYWKTSVLNAIRSWANFNGCADRQTQKVGDRLLVHRHFNCRDDAEVTLYVFQGGSHAHWFGAGNPEENPSAAMWQWLLDHPKRMVPLSDSEMFWSPLQIDSPESPGFQAYRIMVAGAMALMLSVMTFVIIVRRHVAHNRCPEPVEGECLYNSNLHFQLEQQELFTDSAI